jgi:histone arginine demethylase JMJD6
MFVPGGWWHAVINLDNTIAITENIVNHGNFERVWTQTRVSRKRLAYRWLRLLRREEKMMYKIAIEMNKRDNFVMWRPAGDVNDRLSGDGSSSSVSSSTSSSSSASSDDMRTIDVIRDGLPDIRES